MSCLKTAITLSIRRARSLHNFICLLVKTRSDYSIRTYRLTAIMTDILKTEKPSDMKIDADSSAAVNQPPEIADLKKIKTEEGIPEEIGERGASPVHTEQVLTSRDDKTIETSHEENAVKLQVSEVFNFFHLSLCTTIFKDKFYCMRK